MDAVMARLKPAVTGGKESLSKEALEEIKALSGPRPVRFVLEAAYAWVVIGAAIWGAVTLGHWLGYLLAIVIIGTRQNALGLLMHDQTHASFGGRWGDWVGNLLCAYPLLIFTVEGYARVHLAHHREYFTERDPDFQRKSGNEWSFPKSRGELAILFLKDLIGLNTLKMLKGKNVKGPGLPDVPRKGQVPSWLRIAFFVIVLGTVTALGVWKYFLLFWVLPLLTLLPAIVRWGAICEHEYNLAGAGLLESTPLIVQPWYEKALLPMLNFGLHPYHHMFPGVTFSQLPKVHAVFERAGLVDEQRVFRGSLSYLRFITKGEDKPSLAAA